MNRNSTGMKPRFAPAVLPAVLIAALAFGLSGCLGGGDRDGALPMPSADPVVTVDRRAAAAGLEAGPAAAGEPTHEGVAMENAGLAPIEVNDDPGQFLGASSTALADALGPPGFLRRDGPAEVWQYRRDGGAGCVLDVFLYMTGEDLLVRHVELRGPPATTAQRRACLAAMLRDRRVAGAG